MTLILFIALFVFNLQDSFNSSLKVLNEQSGILTLISILAAIIVFFYQQHNEKDKFNQRIVNACKALLADLSHLEGTYKGLERITDPEKGIEYGNIWITTEYYNSVVNSGLITYFDKKTQVELSQFYLRISLFNQWRDELIRFGLYSVLQEPRRTTVLNDIQKMMTDHQKEIESKLPIVKNLLDVEIKKFSKSFLARY